MTIPGPPEVRFRADGLVVAVVQEQRTGAVLMVAYMNREALELTLQSGEAHFWSRSRGRIWHKGKTSGARLLVQQVQADCDQDALLVSVLPLGPACHLGTRSCFPEPATVLDRLEATIGERDRLRPEGSYTARLLQGGPALPARKVGEEAVEVILAALGEEKEALVREAGDLVYHLAVLLRGRGVGLEAVLAELGNRQRPDLETVGGRRPRAT